MPESYPVEERSRAADPIDPAEDAARKQAEDARTLELIRVSAEHAGMHRSGGHFSQAELTHLVDAVEQDLKKSRDKQRLREAGPTGVERRRSDIAPKP